MKLFLQISLHFHGTSLELPLVNHSSWFSVARRCSTEKNHNLRRINITKDVWMKHDQNWPADEAWLKVNHLQLWKFFDLKWPVCHGWTRYNMIRNYLYPRSCQCTLIKSDLPILVDETWSQVTYLQLRMRRDPATADGETWDQFMLRWRRKWKDLRWTVAVLLTSEQTNCQI